PVELTWREITLPPPDGTRNVLAGTAVCDGHWYLVGGHGLIGADEESPGADEPLLGTDDTMDPAAWTSRDGQTWTALPVAAYSYYGVRSLLWGAACRNGTLVALGGKVGGAHGNPRMASYYPTRTADGTEVLTEISASFELYGGPKATNVGRITAGPPGYLIVGNRSAGAAVWLSPTGETFEIVEGAPVLSDSPERATWAADATFHDGEWIVVGSVVPTGRPDRDPAAWRSPDGRTWTAMPAEATTDYDELSVVASVAGSLTAIGTHGPTFRAWRLEPDGWRASGRFGSTHVEPRDGRLTSAIPVDLAAAGDHLVAVVQAGWTYELWISADAGASWRPVAAPIDMAAEGGRHVAVAGIPSAGDAPDQVLLLVDDGRIARAYVASVTAVS
ncbi:MAG: hypothetical protein IRY85_13185, partial [Micromonosporaceae bacterium]|nr:hypothetical protein [Micromonosporaceae bacterium]